MRREAKFLIISLCTVEWKKKKLEPNSDKSCQPFSIFTRNALFIGNSERKCLDRRITSLISVIWKRKIFFSTRRWTSKSLTLDSAMSSRQDRSWTRFVASYRKPEKELKIFNEFYFVGSPPVSTNWCWANTLYDWVQGQSLIRLLNHKVHKLNRFQIFFWRIIKFQFHSWSVCCTRTISRTKVWWPRSWW